MSLKGEKKLKKEFTPGLKFSAASDIEDLISEKSMPNTIGYEETLEKKNHLFSPLNEEAVNQYIVLDKNSPNKNIQLYIKINLNGRNMGILNMVRLK